MSTTTRLGRTRPVCLQNRLQRRRLASGLVDIRKPSWGAAGGCRATMRSPLGPGVNWRSHNSNTAAIRPTGVSDLSLGNIGHAVAVSRSRMHQSGCSGGRRNAANRKDVPIVASAVRRTVSAKKRSKSNCSCVSTMPVVVNRILATKCGAQFLSRGISE